MAEKKEMPINQWLDKLLANGIYSFALDTLNHEIPGHSETAVKRSLSRLRAKGRIISLHKGYYLILPPQFLSKGILPPSMFLDSLMKHLQRPYYVALLNAAAYHGAAHQQPQEYFVVTGFPVLRPTLKKGQKINYISINEIPDSLIEKKKTEAGYLKISNAVLTASDLIQFEKRVGGLNRVAAVISELVDVIKPIDFTPFLLNHAHTTALQRLGFILEYICMNMELADALFDSLQGQNLRLFRIPLKAAKVVKGFSSENRWNVIVNTVIEIEE